jgi:hypothetical protein
LSIRKRRLQAAIVPVAACPATAPVALFMQLSHLFNSLNMRFYDDCCFYKSMKVNISVFFHSVNPTWHQ